MARLHEFLEGTKFKDNVICDRVSSCKHPSDVSFNVVYRTGTGDAIEALDKRAAFEAAMQKEGFENAFAFDQNYLLAETDKAIWYLTYTNMLFALAAILAIMLVFNPLPVAFWITVCVALIDVDLLGVLYLCNLKLNAVTYVNLVCCCAARSNRLLGRGVPLLHCARHAGQAVSAACSNMQLLLYLRHAVRLTTRGCPADIAKQSSATLDWPGCCALLLTSQS